MSSFSSKWGKRIIQLPMYSTSGRIQSSKPAPPLERQGVSRRTEWNLLCCSPSRYECLGPVFATLMVLLQKTICYWKQVNDANDQQCLGRDFKGAKHREGQSTSQNWNIKFLCSVMISVPILLTANQSNTQVPATSARRWNSRIGQFTPKLTNRRLPARWE